MNGDGSENKAHGRAKRGRSSRIFASNLNGDRSETKARQKLAFLLPISRIMNNEAKIKLVAERSEAKAIAFLLQISKEIEAKIIALQP